MSRMKTEYRRRWVCGVVLEETSHEGGCCRFESCRPCNGVTFTQKYARLVVGRWGPSLKTFFFYLFLAFLAMARYLSVGGRHKNPPALRFLYWRADTRQHWDDLCWHKVSGERSTRQQKPLLNTNTNHLWPTCSTTSAAQEWSALESDRVHPSIPWTS
jgi:hypothetical protein